MAAAAEPERRPVRLVLASRNAHKLRELGAAAARRTSSCRCPTEVELPPETGETFADNALIKARAAASATGRAGDRRRLRHRGRRARRRARASARRATPARTRPTRRTSPSCCARCPPDGDRAWPTSARSPTWSRAARGASSRGAARACSPTSRAATAASATTRRSCPPTTTTAARWPSCRPEEKDAISHRGRAARALARSSASRPRRGAVSGAGRRRRRPRRSCDRRGRGTTRAVADAQTPRKAARRVSIASNSLLIVLKLAAGGDHRLDRDHHRGDPLEHRPGRLGRRLLLGAQGRRAGRRGPPLRPRRRSRTWPRRSRGC